MQAFALCKQSLEGCAYLILKSAARLHDALGKQDETFLACEAA